MEKSIQQLQSIISSYAGRLNNLTENEWLDKPDPAKWSKKEVLGHLIDSAQNNIRRFVVAQYEHQPKIIYAQDNWVASANYQNYITADLINLWQLLNKHMCIILENVPGDASQKICDAGEMRSIEWLAEDYNKHLLHHLHQLLNIEPVLYP
ncbi:MAG: DinB family protein [Ginsengibacter sp.]